MGHEQNWFPSRYGADDVVGSGNELTPERVRDVYGVSEDEFHDKAPRRQ